MIFFVTLHRITLEHITLHHTLLQYIALYCIVYARFTSLFCVYTKCIVKPGCCPRSWPHVLTMHFGLSVGLGFMDSPSSPSWSIKHLASAREIQCCLKLLRSYSPLLSS